jgi:hypothetical protein
MLQEFMVRRGTVYIPTLAETTAGFYRAIEPVATAELCDAAGLKKVLKEMLLRGNPRIPTTQVKGKPVVLKYFPVKSWSQFEKEAAYWTISEKAGIYEFGPWKRREDRGWEEDSTKLRRMPPNSTLDEVVDEVVKSVQVSLKHSLLKHR